MKVLKKAKILKIILNAIPVAAMIALIPIVQNDMLLTAIDIGIIILMLFVKTEKRDYQFLFLGFIIMTFSEYFFIKTGVETFNRTSLMGIMPLWLPVLRAYAFMAIKRVVLIMNKR